MASNKPRQPGQRTATNIQEREKNEIHSQITIETTSCSMERIEELIIL
jgi:hypothetical protein